MRCVFVGRGGKREVGSPRLLEYSRSAWGSLLESKAGVGGKRIQTHAGHAQREMALARHAERLVHGLVGSEVIHPPAPVRSACCKILWLQAGLGGLHEGFCVQKDCLQSFHSLFPLPRWLQEAKNPV